MPSKKPTALPLRRLREYFSVNPNSPSGLTWIKHPAGRTKPIGVRAGTLATGSFWVVTLAGVTMQVHRIVWAMVHDTDPGSRHIKHFDGDRMNNSVQNLYLAASCARCHELQVMVSEMQSELETLRGESL